MVHADPSTYNHSAMNSSPDNALHELSQPDQCMSLEGCFNGLLPELAPTLSLEGCYVPSLSAPPHHHYYNDQQQQQQQHFQVHRPAAAGTASKRLRWSAELHRRFEVSVEQLGGPEKALPSQILKLMNVDQLTIFHIKSHLQRYRGKAATTSLTRDSSDPGSDPSSGAEPSASAAPTSKQAPCQGSSQTITSAAPGPLRRCSSNTPTPASLPSLPATLAHQPSLSGSLSLPPPQPMQAVDTLGPTPPLPAPPTTSQAPPPSHSPDPLKLQQALIVQIELQKQLHNQLKLQKELQASLEMHALYIQHLVGRSQSKRASQGADRARPEGEVQSRQAA